MKKLRFADNNAHFMRVSVKNTYLIRIFFNEFVGNYSVLESIFVACTNNKKYLHYYENPLIYGTMFMLRKHKI